MRILHKLSSLFRRIKIDVEMTEEMRAHLEMQTEQNIAAGMNPDEARYLAQRQFGNVAGIQERVRDARGWVWVEQFIRDLHYAVRSLWKAPNFTLTAVLTLGLGVGVNSALFTAYNAIALRSLPVKEPESLVKVLGQNTSQPGAASTNWSFPEYLNFRDGNRALSDLAAIWPAIVSVDDGSPAAADMMFDVRGAGTALILNVSDNYFRTLGGGFELGRGFLPEENRVPGDGAVIVLSHSFWQRRFHGNPAAIGQMIRLRGRPYTVIGVTAEGFAGDQSAPPLGWVPIMNILRNEDLTRRNFSPLRLVGRLRPGVTEQQAEMDLDLIASRQALENPSEHGRDAVSLERGMRFMTIPVNAKTLAAVTPVLFGFALVLLIACTNVANLLLARGITRQQEIGVRLTLGASRPRILRQLFTENLLLCALGAAAGLLFATWTLQMLKPIAMSQLPPEWAYETRRWMFLSFTPDFRVAVFTAVVALVAAIGAGLIPALQSSRADLVSSLKNDGTALGRKFGQTRLRNFLVVAQVAVCLMLLSCAGLLVRNTIALRHPDLGFDSEPVFEVSIESKGAPRGDPQSAYDLRREAIRVLRTLPDVVSATLARWGPMLGGPETGVSLPDAAVSQPAESSGRYCFVSDGFIETFGLHLLRGRSFTAGEVMTDRRVIVLSESAARHFWPGQQAIGRFVGLRGDIFDAPGRTVRGQATREFQVIGVVADVSSTLLEQKHVLIYAPISPEAAAATMQGGRIYLRPRSDSTAMLASIVREADAAGEVLQFDRRVSANITEQRLPFLGLSALSGLLAGLALLMASVGLFGVMSFSVNQREREIGIRSALGATTADIIRLVVSQGMRLIAVGIVVGLGSGLLFALLLPRILFGAAGAFDPISFSAVTGLFAAVALLACWLPARRAAKVDPMIALRAE
ncbi:MAG TPA: ABC transporter permease [Lacunisphaera sp.]|jgi:predicted permease